MTSKKLNIENFKAEKIDRNQQKAIRGGDDPTTPPIDGNKDPIKGGGGTLG
ncbi:rSAM-modified peptide [Flavobacterium sp. 22076]|uniref:rSAM-modified peptide n=1 Tax=unclassified Flavobacterium TaxID=196869 RepID=UPI003F83C87E